MGNHRFRLSDMMPNAWFYKLKDMSAGTRNRSNSPQSTKKKLATPNTTLSHEKPFLSQPRYYSYHLTPEPNRAEKFCNSPINPKASDTHFPDPPRKSPQTNSKRKSVYKPSPRLVSSSVAAVGCSCRATFNSVWTKPADTTSHQYEDYSVSCADRSPEPEFESDPFDDRSLASSWCGSCNCRVSSSTTDIIIDMNEKSYTRKIDKFDDFDMISEPELPPILTKPPKFNLTTTATTTTTKEVTKIRRSSSKSEESLSIKIVKEERIKAKKPSTTATTGVKLRTNTPRIASRKVQGHGRKNKSSTTASKSRTPKFLESFAIVKSSNDPERDFRDSMVEMIVENNIRASKDLEELLACYLLLNSNEYHDLIVKAFQQIWFNMTELRIHDRLIAELTNNV